MIDTTLALDNPLCSRKNLLERIQKLIMTIHDKVRDEKLQYDINREVAKISALSSGKIDEYEYLTYSTLGKTLEKPTEKQLDALKSLNFPNKVNELN